MKRYAILIGSSRFDKEPKLNPLRCPENDVDGMHEVVSAAELGAFTETFVYKNADHQTILKQIEGTLHEAGNEDQVLIYYSGHGKRGRTGQLYLTTVNTENSLLQSTSIPLPSLREIFENSSCKKIALILDCCFAGAAGDAFKSDDEEMLKEFSSGNGIHLLTASTANQTAVEKEADTYSLLTKHIINGIKSGAAAGSSSSQIGMKDLYLYVQSQVTAEGYQQPMYWAWNVRGEDLVIARASYSTERLRVFKKEINNLDTNNQISQKIANDARRIISDNQLQRDQKFFDLLNHLCDGTFGTGIFSEKWLELMGAPKQVEQPRVRVPEPAKTHQPQKPPPYEQQEKVEPEPPQQEEQSPELRKQQNTARKVGLGVAGVVVLGIFFWIVVQINSSPINSAPMPEATSLKPADLTEDINGVKLEMILLPAGKFTMGSDQSGSQPDNEKPPHEVTVSSFHIGKYEVTQAQWKAVMGDNLQPIYQGDDLPMENISWKDAQAFCQKLSQLTGKEYRLPSEAEWEYACRAGTTRDPAGMPDEMGWSVENADRKTHPVGQKKPNAFGLYDMHGNVLEWCEDWWYENYTDAPEDGTAWTDGGNAKLRILRGGSWIVKANDCRSAVRYNEAPDSRGNDMGFRVVVAART